MAIDVQGRGSDGWWLHRLAKKLEGRRERLDRLHAYYRGEPPLPESMQHLAPAYYDFLKTSRSNWAELVARLRMQVTGFRVVSQDAQMQGDDEAGDAEMWQMWRRLGLPVESAEVHDTMGWAGDAYVIAAWPEDLGLDHPVVTYEDPRQVVTIHDPRWQRRVRAGAKFYHDPDSGRDYAWLYLPGRNRVAVRDRQTSTGTSAPFTPSAYTWAEDLPEGDPDLGIGGPLPDGMEDLVCVVRFRNRNGVGDFERHVDVLDRINRMVLRRLVIASHQAFRQRALEVPEDKTLPTTDEDGQEIDYSSMFESGPDALWLLPPGVKLWESGQVNLDGILAAAKHDVQTLAAVTRTSLHMLAPDSVAQSAEGAQLQREGQADRKSERITRASDGWSQVMALVYAYLGDEARADVGAIEALWEPVERYSLSERASAWSQTAGMPFASRARHVWQASPAELGRMRREQTADLLLQPPAAPGAVTN